MSHRVNDPVWLHLASLAQVKPPHCWHLHCYLKAVRGKFNAAGYAVFAGLEVRHVTRMLEVFEAEGLCEPAQAATAPLAARGTRLPADFTMPDTWLMWAETERGWSREVSETEAARFTDHFHSAPGQKGVHVQWDATWRNWVRRSTTPNGKRAADGNKAFQSPDDYRQFCKDQIERATQLRDYAGVRSWRQKLAVA